MTENEWKFEMWCNADMQCPFKALRDDSTVPSFLRYQANVFRLSGCQQEWPDAYPAWPCAQSKAQKLLGTKGRLVAK
jgi:hypothetical protein